MPGSATGQLLHGLGVGDVGRHDDGPGAQGLQAELPRLVPRLGGVRIDERFVAAGMLGMTALGCGLDRRAALR